MYEECRRRKTFHVSFMREKCEVVCSCYLFEFRGIVSRHAITVLIWNDSKHITNRYILRDGEETSVEHT